MKKNALNAENAKIPAQSEQSVLPEKILRQLSASIAEYAQNIVRMAV